MRLLNPYDFLHNVSKLVCSLVHWNPVDFAENKRIKFDHSDNRNVIGDCSVGFRCTYLRALKYKVSN